MDDEPSSYKQAMKSPDAERWRKACEDEYQLLMGYKTWELIATPSNVNIVGNHWTFRVKRDNLGNVN